MKREQFLCMRIEQLSYYEKRTALMYDDRNLLFPCQHYMRELSIRKIRMESAPTCRPNAKSEAITSCEETNILFLFLALFLFVSLSATCISQASKYIKRFRFGSLNQSIYLSIDLSVSRTLSSSSLSSHSHTHSLSPLSLSPLSLSLSLSLLSISLSLSLYLPSLSPLSLSLSPLSLSLCLSSV